MLMFFLIQYFEITFVSSIISLHVITESSMIHVKYLPFSQLHVAGFQI